MSIEAVRHLTIATAGHIDHGKSTLVEALTGVHPDRLKEERARGISIELGFAHTRLGDTAVSFVDVPGHERFVRHMLAGIGGIDGLLCIVAADESVMPQTREHVAIAGLLGVRRAVVAVTKTDLVDADLVGLVALEAEELLHGHGLEVVAVVPVSARNGTGLDVLRTALLTLAAERQVRDLDGPARLPVDRVFSMRGFGTVVTGTLWSGRLRVDQEIAVQPGERPFRIRGLQVHGQPADVATAGQRVAVNLAQATLDDVARGVVLAEDGSVLVTRRLDVALHMLDDAPPLRHGARVHVHVGTAMGLARVALLGASAADVRDIGRGQDGLARLRLEAPLALRRGDRFVLRSYSPVATVGGGVVIDPAPPRRLSRAAAATRLAALQRVGIDVHDLRPALEGLVAGTGAEGLDVSALAPRLGVAPAQVALALAAVPARALLVVGDRLVAAADAEALRGQVLADVDAHHAASPESDGLPRQSVRERRGRRAHPGVVDYVVSALLGDGTLVVDEDRLARPLHRHARVAEAGARAAVLARAEGAGLLAVTHEELVAATGLPSAAAEAVLRHAVRDAALVKLGTLYVSGAAASALVADLRAQQARDAATTIDVGWFKERYGVTRRTAIPLLEWLDRQRVTRRAGDARVVLAP